MKPYPTRSGSTSLHLSHWFHFKNLKSAKTNKKKSAGNVMLLKHRGKTGAPNLALEVQREIFLTNVFTVIHAIKSFTHPGLGVWVRKTFTNELIHIFIHSFIHSGLGVWVKTRWFVCGTLQRTFLSFRRLTLFMFISNIWSWKKVFSMKFPL